MPFHEHIEALFQPHSVAVIGASATPGKIGYMVLANIVNSGYRGALIPVNPRGGDILGLPACASIEALPGPLDLAVICIPPAHVIAALKSLTAVGVKAVIVITAGFKEAGREGHALEQEVIRIAREHRIALLGPNCLGLLNTGNGLNATFAAGRPQAGNIAFFSQSGALCVSILDWALGNNIGFSKFISLGNKAVLTETDMLAYLAEDPHTRVILGYVESIDNGAAFLEVARQAARKKPVVMIKSGTTAAGAKAASSHTGAIAGSDQAYTAAFRQAGVIRVRDVASLFNLAQAFSTQPLPKGPNLAIITNSGGPGIMAADTCAETGLTLTSPSQASVEKLRSFLPAYASLYNPIDIIGDADAERYARTLDVILADEMTHAVLILLSPTATAEPEKTARAVIGLTRHAVKPIFSCFMGEFGVSAGKRLLQDAGIPCYAFPEPALHSIDAMYRHFERAQTAEAVMKDIPRDLAAAKDLLAKSRAAGLHELVEFQAQGLARAYGLPLPETRLARTSDEAVAAAQEIGYPVVLKVASQRISHKSDIGGVRVNLGSEAEVRSAFLDITSRARRVVEGASLWGCLVQKMAPKGSKEVFIGFKRDAQFGPLLLFGLGGIYVEVLKDISFRLAPLSTADAHAMIREVRSFPLLRGVRGEPPVNFQAIEDVLLAMSRLALDLPEIQEAEFNPVLVDREHALVADIRVILAQEP